MGGEFEGFEGFEGFLVSGKGRMRSFRGLKSLKSFWFMN
jgi:hypothetical protein